MRVTMDDIAKRVGVSKTTVSRILNQKDVQVSAETRQKVLDAVRELDYHPNELARGLKMSETNVIGIILSNLRNPFWSMVLDGVEEACNQMGYHLMICNSGEDGDLEKEYIKGLQRRRVDGIIINPTVQNRELFTEMVDQGFPLILINRKLHGLHASTVAMDNVQGASLAVEHLLRLGRRRIALITYDSTGISTWTERIQGYKETLLRHGYGEESFIIQSVKQVDGAAVPAVVEMLRGAQRPDAIFSTNNLLTLEIMEALREVDVRVPEDIALVGYDETVWAKHMNPPLTTVSQPARDMGKIAVETLIETIKSKRVYPRTIVLPPELIIRRSSGI